ncbi:MAG: carboxypeptidase-like regulatory domain-containing protein [candidate division WOR-3 bacterium]
MIESLSPGRYWLSATASDFVPGHYPESVEGVVGQVTPLINFHLTPGGQTGGISGQVTDAHTRLPIRGAYILADGPNGRGTAQTESCGGYVMAEPPAGRYLARAEAQGYEPEVFPESATVTGGHTTPDINFALQPSSTPGGVVSGRVVRYPSG